jgi:molybdenum cofactor synthesis domain-containing protein
MSKGEGIVSELRIGIITCSDSVVEGAEDQAGLALMKVCEERGWYVIGYHVCPRDAETICGSIIDLADADEADVIFTLGGTGLGPRDITPEATERSSERMVPGIAEAIRGCANTPVAEHLLSRAVAGIREQTLIINLPGEVESVLRAFGLVSDHLDAAKMQLDEANVPAEGA